MSSIYGRLFRISTWGESHGLGVGVVIDGCPAGLDLTEADIQADLDRRRPGQNKLTTPRKEADAVEIWSGHFEGKTTGTPLSLLVRNADQRSHDYADMQTLYRPSHADFTYDAKYGFRDFRGGGRSSARETVGRVAAGAVARKLLRQAYGIEVTAYVDRIGTVEASLDPLLVTLDQVEKSLVRCPDPKASAAMEKAVAEAKKARDSLGGTIQLVVKNCPAGLGEPVFHRVEAELAHAFLSLPATKGFEVGSGFAGTLLKGSEHNDAFVNKEGRIGTETNRSGGVQGGITNGEPILCRIAFKPTATISMPQRTVNQAGEDKILEAKGRHDPCVLPRAVVIVEAMAALTLIDLVLEHRARYGFLSA